MAHSWSFLANQKARNAIVVAENLLKLTNQQCNDAAAKFSGDLSREPHKFLFFYQSRTCNKTIALFKVNFSHLHYNVIQRGCQAVSDWNYKIARNCLADMLDFIVMQMSRVNSEKGYWRSTWICYSNCTWEGTEKLASILKLKIYETSASTSADPRLNSTMAVVLYCGKIFYF